MVEGRTIIAAWRQLAGLPTDPRATIFEDATVVNRESLFQNALRGGVTLKPWKIGSDEYSKACEAWLEWFISADGYLPKASKKTIQDFDELIQQMSLYRRLIRTDDGKIGFGPERSQEGDSIVILPGGKVPYVLRHVQATVSGAPRFRLLGDAFILGVMDGEAIDLQTSVFEEIVIL
ncbi:hypothetical protein ACHAPI_010161 [Fusarium lateritium]